MRTQNFPSLSPSRSTLVAAALALCPLLGGCPPEDGPQPPEETGYRLADGPWTLEIARPRFEGRCGEIGDPRELDGVVVEAEVWHEGREQVVLAIEELTLVGTYTEGGFEAEGGLSGDAEPPRSTPDEPNWEEDSEDEGDEDEGDEDVDHGTDSGEADEKCEIEEPDEPTEPEREDGMSASLTADVPAPESFSGELVIEIRDREMNCRMSAEVDGRFVGNEPRPLHGDSVVEVEAGGQDGDDGEGEVAPEEDPA